MNDIGVIHGRFQALHLGHLEYLLAGKSKCKFLYVGITNPDPLLTTTVVEDRKRDTEMANPFTYFERLEIVRDTLLDAGVMRSEFEIIPFPITHPHLIKYYAPPCAMYFVTIYDEWGRAKAATLRSLGLDVEVMWERSMTERLTSGTEIRHLIAQNSEWKHLVPSAFVDYVTKHGLQKRIELLSHE